MSNLRSVSPEVEVAVLADYRAAKAIEAAGSVPRGLFVEHRSSSHTQNGAANAHTRQTSTSRLLSEVRGHVSAAEIQMFSGMSDAYLCEALAHIAGILADRDGATSRTPDTLRRIADALPRPPMGAA